MSYLIICDFCGREIDREGSAEQMVTVNATGDKGGPKRERWKSGYVGHYHHGECWTRVFRAIEAIHLQGESLEAIPTATPAQLSELRPGGQLDHEPLWRSDTDTRPRYETRDLGLEKENLSPTEFRRAGIETVGHLRAAIRDRSLLRVKGVGRTRLDRIARRLASFESRALAPRPPSWET
jgi:hypothetical protein